MKHKLNKQGYIEPITSGILKKCYRCSDEPCTPVECIGAEVIPKIQEIEIQVGEIILDEEK